MWGQKKEIGDLIGNEIVADTAYRLKRKIAGGGMGSIYEAQQVGVEGFVKTVAIKILRPELSENKEFVSMLIGEADLVARLVHQNIVQIHQLGKHADEYFIVMEHIDGVDLEEFMDRHKELEREVRVELAAYIASRICRGLEYAHSKKDERGQPLDIVHRDVSPRNIMITSEGEVKLTDFGVAKARRYVSGELKDNVMVGKVPYMSPEQATYASTDVRSDVFSAGVVLYELLTGVRIHERDEEEDAIKVITKGKTPDPGTFRDNLPPDLVTIVSRCLERNPAERYQTAGEVGYALEYYMYSKGYGPTIVTLAQYMAELYPEKHFYVAPSRGDNMSSTMNES